MGPQGLRAVALQNLRKAAYAKGRLGKVPGCGIRFGGPTFNEFVVRVAKKPAAILKQLLKHDIIGGVDLGRFYPDLADCLLLCVTEQDAGRDRRADPGAGRRAMSGPERTVGAQGLVFNEPLIFEQGSPGRVGYSLPPCDVPEKPPETLIPPHLLRGPIPGLPEVSEVDVVRHYTRISQWNFGIDLGFYPLGSCTMKYNPRVNEDMVRLPGFAKAHPYLPDALAQGALELLWELERYLAEISGLDRVSLHPSAGAHGELTGVMMIRAYHQSKGNPRRKIIIPESAHGTNPASSALCGYQVVSVKSGPQGVVEPAAVAEVMDDQVAARMITNPNTLGLFEEHIAEIAAIVHAKGGQVYCDGANLNAIMGVTRPGDWGVDVIQINLHKTFSQPHGGGGPGAGPVAVRKHLAPFMPLPTVEKTGDSYALDFDRPKSIGKVRSFAASFGVMVRAYAYIRSWGGGLPRWRKPRC
jgi:glycine dehydrogenase subunit 2